MALRDTTDHWTTICRRLLNGDRTQLPEKIRALRIAATLDPPPPEIAAFVDCLHLAGPAGSGWNPILADLKPPRPSCGHASCAGSSFGVLACDDVGGARVGVLIALEVRAYRCSGVDKHTSNQKPLIVPCIPDANSLGYLDLADDGVRVVRDAVEWALRDSDYSFRVFGLRSIGTMFLIIHLSGLRLGWRLVGGVLRVKTGALAERLARWEEQVLAREHGKLIISVTMKRNDSADWHFTPGPIGSLGLPIYLATRLALARADTTQPSPLASGALADGRVCPLGEGDDAEAKRALARSLRMVLLEATTPLGTGNPIYTTPKTLAASAVAQLKPKYLPAAKNRIRSAIAATAVLLLVLIAKLVHSYHLETRWRDDVDANMLLFSAMEPRLLSERVALLRAAVDLNPGVAPLAEKVFSENVAPRRVERIISAPPFAGFATSRDGNLLAMAEPLGPSLTLIDAVSGRTLRSDALPAECSGAVAPPLTFSSESDYLVAECNSGTGGTRFIVSSIDGDREGSLEPECNNSWKYLRLLDQSRIGLLSCTGKEDDFGTVSSIFVFDIIDGPFGKIAFELTQRVDRRGLFGQLNVNELGSRALTLEGPSEDAPVDTLLIFRIDDVATAVDVEEVKLPPQIRGFNMVRATFSADAADEIVLFGKGGAARLALRSAAFTPIDHYTDIVVSSPYYGVPDRMRPRGDDFLSFREGAELGFIDTRRRPYTMYLLRRSASLTADDFLWPYSRDGAPTAALVKYEHSSSRGVVLSLAWSADENVGSTTNDLIQVGSIEGGNIGTLDPPSASLWSFVTNARVCRAPGYRVVYSIAGDIGDASPWAPASACSGAPLNE